MPIRPDDEELTIKVGGKTVGGWERFSVTRGVELLPSILSVYLTERWPGQIDNVTLAPFQPVEAFLGNDLILTGYVDLYEPRATAAEHQVSIGCRSKTEDLIDCSVDVDALATANASWAILSPTLGAAAKMLAKPYGIEVVVIGDDPPLDPQFPVSVHPGESVYQVIETLARLTRTLIWDDEKGRLVLSGVGTKRAANPLVEGINIEVEQARLDGSQRFQKIIVFGQYVWSDAKTGPHISFRSERTDTRVPRNRMLMVPIDLPGPNQKWLDQRAEWEIARRYGRSRAVRITVTGWRDRAGALWTPNTLVKVNAPSLKIDEDMLIAQCTWRRDERGTQTDLYLMPPSGLAPAPFHFKPLVTIDPNVRATPNVEIGLPQIVGGQ